MDDKFLYACNWIHGDISQYDISETSNPKLVGKVKIGGLIYRGSKIQPKSNEIELPDPNLLKGKQVRGGPQTIQASLDGKRLYVTTSLFSPWDKQFYPEMHSRGSMMFLINADIENGGLILDQDFLIDFGDEPHGPVGAHEMKYPGGDCTSDIFL